MIFQITIQNLDRVLVSKQLFDTLYAFLANQKPMCVVKIR